MKRFRLVLLVGVLGLVATTADARTIQITSGVFTAVGIVGGASGTFAGDGFSFTGGGLGGGGVNPVCFPCRPGESASLRTTYSGSDLIGSGIVDGVPTEFGSPDSGRVGMLFEFTGSVLAPPESSADVTLDAPFAFTARVSAPFNHDLVGAGTAHAVFRPITGGPFFLWQLRETAFEFAPVPEPGTLGLVGGGAAAGIARAIRRRFR